MSGESYGLSQVMAVRRCTEADVDAVAELCARACSDDPLLGDLMHPWRKQYPDDFVAYFRKRTLKTLHIASHHHVITTEVIGEHEVVTGYAEWARKRAGDKEHLAVSTTADTSDNRAADPAYADIFERASVFTRGYWTGARAESWYLDLLMVDPSHQRKGLGRKLVHYGLALADEEGVCASLIASEAGDGLYASCGFEAVGWMQEGEGNPLQGVPGGRIFFREPRNAQE